ncbi:allophanate hydrolase subunit 1 [Photobacterium kishitanii]|uniref:5-oxoprolinase subunit PxpB n=1 Tax=Photobacterium kishitanii TaxID=318456 RepID=UPI0005D42273|nr:5-oxoprolinase subunit PxpB [Photobacterium kishitanii]KJG06362.1 hypothetical protein UB40_20005 [Photobacterium kishitanii]PSV02894.1 allophanate hydrolase subunit 1 [Photobacterium kishitanii]PSV76690.1 allophanate hydrolase subunit 1 [Photobacterium kishitanii]
MKISPISEGILMVEFSDIISAETTQCIAAFVDYIQQQYSPFIVEVVPSYTKVMLQYKLSQCDFTQLQQISLKWYQGYNIKRQSISAKVHHLEVYYHPEVGPDLQALARLCQLSIEAVIKLHSRQFYDVGAIGFAPGFAFLSAVDEAIAVPRHSTPRQYVPAGSVGIADQQTAIYPQKSPGGWHIIGNCPQSVFEAQSYPQSCFAIGDKVKFDPIDRSRFLELGGTICPV